MTVPCRHCSRGSHCKQGPGALPSRQIRSDCDRIPRSIVPTSHDGTQGSRLKIRPPDDSDSSNSCSPADGIRYMSSAGLGIDAQILLCGTRRIQRTHAVPATGTAFRHVGGAYRRRSTNASYDSDCNRFRVLPHAHPHGMRNTPSLSPRTSGRDDMTRRQSRGVVPSMQIASLRGRMSRPSSSATNQLHGMIRRAFSFCHAEIAGPSSAIPRKAGASSVFSSWLPSQMTCVARLQ
jgi:hypothetical protein